MAVTVRFGLWCAVGALGAWACGSHHTVPEPGAGSPAPMAGRPATAGTGSAEAGRDVGPAMTPPGARAVVELLPVDPAKLDAPDGAKGRATFAAQVGSIDLSVMMVRGCSGPMGVPITIKEGLDCSEATLSGPTWDAPRGEGIPSATCIGPSWGTARAQHSRSNEADKPWTIGGPSESDIVGHAMVAHDPVTLEALACGVIERADDAAFAPAPPATGTKLQIQAQIAGICLSSTFAPNNPRPCPDPAELVKCSSEHCNLGACLEECKDFTACLETKTDACESMFECPASDACIDCQGQVGYCAFSFCLAEVSCAPPPTPDGPCAQLTACCQMQHERAAMCLEFVKVLERVSGDSSCRGAMMDWDTVVHLEVPCKFD